MIDDTMIDAIAPMDWATSDEIIKVLGVGGGGCNAIDRMLSMGYGVDDVEFIAANTIYFMSLEKSTDVLRHRSNDHIAIFVAKGIIHSF